MEPSIHLVTGKGGVGKSVFAAALAHRQSIKGQNALLIALEGPESRELGFPLFESFKREEWTGESCLKEYFDFLLKIPGFSHLILKNKALQSLIRVAPGLSELALLGKLTSRARSHGPSMKFDSLIMDAYSTGHFLNLIKVPEVVSKSPFLGLLREQSTSIDEILRDPHKTAFHVMAIPELFALEEAKEIFLELSLRWKQRPYLYLNKMLPLALRNYDGDPPKGALGEWLCFHLERERRARELLLNWGISFREISLVESENLQEVANEITKEISKEG